MKYVKCDLCGSDNYITVLRGRDLYNNIPGEFTVVKCSTCGFIYTNPQPFDEELAYFYPDTAGYFVPTAPEPEAEKPANSTNYGTLKKYFQERNLAIEGVPGFVENGKLLDVGCSYGFYLKKMKDLGWDTAGIEQNKKAAEYGTKQLGLKIFDDTFENISLSEKFDVISMRMVLEHFHSPTQMLEKAFQLLKDDGRLIIIVPDFSGLEFRIFKEYCYALQVPTHLNHFTPATIKKLCAKCGFIIERIVHHKFDRDFVASAQYMEDKGTISRFFAKLLINL